MPELSKVPEEDNFFDHPCATLFVEAAFNSLDAKRDPTIPAYRRRELMGHLGLSWSETANLANQAQEKVRATQTFAEELSELTLGSEHEL